MEYAIVSSVSPKDLEKAVNVRIRAGWRPQGGVSASKSEFNTKYMQAMVRGKDES